MKKFTFALYFLLGALCAADSVVAAEADWVVNLVSPTVVTNFNKYGEDVLEITGAATNGYKSVSEALEAARPGDTVSLVTNANETLRFAHEGVFAIDLNGFTLAPSVGETDVVCFDGVSSNSVVSIANGTLSGNLRLGLSGAVPTSSGFVILGPELVSDGDIFATGNIHVRLTDGFRSTYTNGVFSTEVPLEAQEGAIFGYRHNPKDVRKPGKLVFDSPELQLVSQDGGFRVKEPQILKQWSFDLKNWMADIPDETPIYKICIPGAHDCGMSGDNMEGISVASALRWLFISKDMYQTQSLGFKDQLNAGTRIFDLRFCKTTGGDDIRTYHGADSDSAVAAMYGESFDSIVKAVKEFMAVNTSDFVILELSHFGKTGTTDEKDTQELVLKKLFEDADFTRLLLTWEDKGKSLDNYPMVNDLTLGQVRGKVILLVSAEKETDGIDPRKGIWGFGSGGDWRYTMKNGYYGILDDYANRDSVKAVKEYYLGKDGDESSKGVWTEHTEKRIAAEGQGRRTTAFSLSWTETFNPKQRSILKNFWFWLWAVIGAAGSIAALVVAVTFGLAVSVFMGPLAGFVAGLKIVLVSMAISCSPLLAYWRFMEFGHGIKDMASEMNPILVRTVSDCMEKIDPNTHTNKYLKPTIVFYDYVEAKINRGIIALNANLCRYAAEVVRPDGTVAGKYETLNDAFSNELFRMSNNGCTVRLLRSEEPDDANGFEVKADGHVKFDLNGKWLRRGDRLAADKPLLTNRGELEIVNTKTDIGGFEKIGMTSVAGVNGAALFNDAGGRLTVRDVAFPEGKSLLSAYALIHSVGGKVVLENVALTGECAGISQSDSELWLTNCTIATSGGPVYMGSGGRIEVCGGRFEHTYELLASGGIVLDKGSTFVLRGGEVRCDSPYEINVNDGACFEVRDGFVRTSSSSTDFEVRGDGAVKLYGGCYSAEPPVKYIVDGVCTNVANYPAYPYEIVPCRNGRLAVAEIREIDNSLYGSVQAAVDEVEKRGGGLTVGLLANTHPSKSIVIPAETAVTLDLQGHGITMRGTEEPVIRNLGGLTVKDSSEEGTGYVSMFVTNGCRAAKSGGIVFNAGVFALAGGTLRTGFAEQGGGLYNETNGYARIDGGVISDCRATDAGGGVCNRGLMDLRGGRIMSCTAGASGGGIRNEGDLRMTEGEVRSCSAEVGGGLSNGHDAVLVGGIIADNESANGVGAGVYADSYTQTTFCGAWVKDAIGVSSQRRSSTARLRIVEGLFGSSLNTAWVADGSLLVPNEDTFSQDEYPHRVLVQYVAQVGRERYATLEDAFRQTISTGGEVEVKLLTDVRNVAEELPDGAYAALDLSGHWLFGAQDALVVHNAARLRVFDSVGGGTVSCLFATNDATACAIRSTGFCAVEGGRYADRVLAADTKAVVRAGLFGQEPRTSLVDPASVSVANADAASRNVFPFAVMARNPARFKDITGKSLALQEALQSECVQGEALHTVEVGENQFDVALVVPTGTRAVLDLCGHVLQGVAHEPVITVEKGAVLTIVDSVGGGRIVKDTLAFYDPRLQGAIVNRGMLTLAGGTIANCIGVTFGGVYNAEGATFVMSGGSIRGCGSTEPMSTYHSAGGVLNAGTFWMTGGEIEDCEAVMGVASVFNEDQAVFRQLGGEIKNGNGVVAEGELACQVLNRGDYLLLDGRVSSDASSQLDESALILNWMSAGSDTRFAQLWGEVSAVGSGCAVCNRDGRAAGRDAEDVVASRISNGKIAGRVVSMPLKAFGVIAGGFFTDDETNVVACATIPEFVAWETNTDAATKDLYSSRITPQYEAEVESGGLVARVSLQQALNLNYSGSYTVKLVTDVKDCVVCSNMVPVTLDLNGYAITGTGKVFGDGFAHSVIRNEGILTVVDSSEKKTGLIAMPSVGEAEMGGAICNLGTLDLGNIAIWGCRARRGGGVYNAPDARARLTNVRMTGCYASDAEAGDLILNAGTLALEGCTLEAWVDATNASHVREGGALVNAGTATLNGCRVRGRIMSLDGAPAVTIASGLFDHEPPTVYRANADAETRLVYRWEVVGEQEIVATLPGEMAGVRGFKTLADAIATAGYGATVTIVGDVTDENVRLPSGLVVRIGETGAFRKPGPEDLLHDYYEVREILEQGRVVGYAISLDAAKVAPQVGDDKSSGTPWLEFVRDDRTGSVTSAVLTLINAYEGLYYGVETGPEPDDLKSTGCWIPSSNRGMLRLEVPAVGDRRFYRIRVTDHLERSILPRIGE